MTQLIIAVDALKCRWQHFSFRQWRRNLIGSVLGRFVGWVFSFSGVQTAILAKTVCGTPIGTALTGAMSSIADEAAEEAIEDHHFMIDADDVKGLDREIDSGIEEYFRHNSLDASDINNLDEMVEKEVGRSVIAMVDELKDDEVALLVAQRMSY